MQKRIQKVSHSLYRQRWALAAAALGAVTFLLLYDWRVIVPTNVQWLLNMSADEACGYLGLLFYWQSPLRLPYIGMSYNVIYPHRISILFSDALSLLGVPCKLLSFLLPKEFQYFGFWAFLCFVLQGFWGQKCIARIGHTGNDLFKNLASLAGAQALVLYPVLLVRTLHHTALAGNWILLAALYLWLRAGDADLTTRKACLWWAVMGFLAANIMMYYLPMVGIVLVGFTVHRALLHRPVRDLVLPIPIYCATALLCIILLGGFASNMTAPSSSFGQNGSDPLSYFVTGLASTWEQEQYMGAGLVLAVALAAAVLVIACVLRPGWLGRVPASARTWAASGGVILLLTVVVSSSNRIIIGGHYLFTWPVPALLARIWGLFRECGRLGWTAGYLMVILAFGLLLRLLRPKQAVCLLAACLAVQTVDRLPSLEPLPDFWKEDALYADEHRLSDPGWQTLSEQDALQHMQFVTKNWEGTHFYDICNFAAEQNWTINTFYLPHTDGGLMEATIAGEMNELRSDTVYVFLDLEKLGAANYPLNYYSLDGVLIGTLDPLPLPQAAPAMVYPLSPAKNFHADAGAVVEGGPSADSIRLVQGSVSGPGVSLLPGRYEVSLEGTGFDHSYVYAGWAQRHYPYHKLDIIWLEGTAEKLVFQFSIEEMAFGWDVAVHMLDDTPITVTSFTVTRID